MLRIATLVASLVLGTLAIPEPDEFGTTNNTHACYVPKKLRVGQPLNFACNLLQYENAIKLHSQFFIGDFDIPIFDDEKHLEPGKSVTVTTNKLPIDIDPSSRAMLRIKGVDTVTEKTLFYYETGTFNIERKSQSIFIQTDKPLYQPGQTVKFRAVNLDYELKPIKDHSVSYEIQDPKNNIILLKQEQSSDMGVVGDELLIHQDSTPGMWKLMFQDETTGFKKEIMFEVKKYKLPKFEVVIEAPSFAYESMDGMNIKLKATYTYGKPVEGEGKLFIEVNERYGPWYWGARSVQPTMPNGEKLLMLNQYEESFKMFKGEAEIFMSRDKLRSMGWISERWSQGKKIDITGSVTEKLTGISFEAEPVEIITHKRIYKIEKLYTPKITKPGLKYLAYLKVSQQDGTPVPMSFIKNNKVIVKINSEKNSDYFYYLPMLDLGEEVNGTIAPPPLTTTTAAPDMDLTVEYDINENGEVVVEFEVPDQDFSRVYFKAYVSEDENQEAMVNWDTSSGESPSGSFLQISTNMDEFSPGTTASFKIRTRKETNHLCFMVKSRGNMLSFDHVTYNKENTEFTYDVTITHDMMPSATLLVSYTNMDSGEIVADFSQFTVKTALQATTSMSSSSTSVDAGDDVTISVATGESGNFVGLKAVDKSVLLLKKGNDIDMNQVSSEMSSYETNSFGNGGGMWWGWWPRVNEGRDASEVFKSADVSVLHDAYLHKMKDDWWPEPFAMGFGVLASSSGRVDFSDTETSGKSGGQRNKPKDKKPRTYFPETWVWNNEKTDDNGVAEFKTAAPDTITSWVLNAFSVSDVSGLGIADERQITVFRNFFINLNLPLKVTRGEIIVVQALVFNYFDTDVEVSLKLHENTDGSFELLIPGGDDKVAGNVRKMSVKSQSSVSISFPLRMTSLGDVAVQVSATSSFASDSLIRKINVQPEGVRECFSESTVFNRDGMDKSVDSNQFTVRFPENVVEGSEQVKLYLYGDLMGSTTANLGELLREPTGCGEQNMQGFAPDVFVTLYLQRAGKLDDVTKNKAFGHFTQGYQNQLNYRHNDGSYSAFGQRDKSGSLWLTAFVVKCFQYAQLVRPEMRLQLENSVKTAFDFINNQQRKDGSFEEPGKVSSRSIQGGVNSDITMAAYVLISLTEVMQNRESEFKETIELTRTYLEDRLDDIMYEPFALAIVTYALHTSESVRAEDALIYLEALATEKDGHKYWQNINENEPDEQRNYYYRPPSNDIEMTSYALLTYVRRDDVESSVPVLKWLASKRNDLGGYSSTQNTVIAIQALSQVASLLSNTKQDITLTVQSDDFSESINIVSENAQVFNRFDLPTTNNKQVTIEADGSGLGVVQMSVCYNVMTSPTEDSPFDCTIDVIEGSLDDAEINLCCQLKDDEPTGMLLYEITLPNGFVVDLSKEVERNKDAKKVEMKKGSANYYYDEMNKQQKICSKTRIERNGKVAGNKPSSIKVIDYYAPKRSFQASYSIGKLESSDACNICGADCAGCPKAELSDWTVLKACTSWCDPNETEVVVRKCVDPNKDQEVAPWNCGIEELPTMTRKCKNKMFPSCPRFHEGLWVTDDRNQYFYGRPMKQRFCTTKMDRPFYIFEERQKTIGSDGIPATRLGNDMYMSCGKSMFSDFDLESGFTISILAKFEQFDDRSRSVLLSYGNPDQRSNFILERVYWGRKDLRFSASVGNKEYRIRMIPTFHVLNKWAHIMVIWHPRAQSVYINGVNVGKVRSYTSRLHREVPNNGHFTIGRDSNEKGSRQGYMDGWVSSVAVWNKVLSRSQVQKTYEFYEPLVTAANQNKEINLTPQMLTFLAQPIRIKK